MISMRDVRRGLSAVAAALALAGPAAAVAAQEAEPSVWRFGIGLLAADPLGDLADYFDNGFGGQLDASFPFDGEGKLRLRVDLGVVVYGHERRNVCFPAPVGCRIGLDLTTTNSIFFGGLGPEIVLVQGPVEPYLNGSLGFSYFVTSSSLSGDGSFENFANTTNLSDGMFAWKVGGGMRFRIRPGPRPISLDLGVERHENGVARFLTKGDIIDNPDGSITLRPNRSEADIVTFRLGVTFGLPRGSRGEG